MPEKELGVVGLGTMGSNLARNLASHKTRVAVYNRTRSRTEEFIANHGREGDFTATATFEELVRALRPPRTRAARRPNADRATRALSAA